MNNTGKLKFKKENDKPRMRDSLIFILIFVLCVVTVVTIQIRSQQKKDAQTLNSQRVQESQQSNDEKTTLASTNPVTNSDFDTKKLDEKEEADRLQAQATRTSTQNDDITSENVDNLEEKSNNLPKEGEDSETKENLTEQKKLKLIKPVDGIISKKFADRELMYSKTMDDWRLHLGTDIAVPIGTKVVACEEGTIEEISDDEQYGTTVVIRHNERLTSRYSNLATTNSVIVGQPVSKGEQIGVVGDSAMYEVLDEPHLHFAISDNGVYVNPAKYITFE